jgi:hypothetical protein
MWQAPDFAIGRASTAASGTAGGEGRVPIPLAWRTSDFAYTRPKEHEQ